MLKLTRQSCVRNLLFVAQSVLPLAFQLSRRLSVGLRLGSQGNRPTRRRRTCFRVCGVRGNWRHWPRVVQIRVLFKLDHGDAKERKRFSRCSHSLPMTRAGEGLFPTVHIAHRTVHFKGQFAAALRGDVL